MPRCLNVLLGEEGLGEATASLELEEAEEAEESQELIKIDNYFGASSKQRMVQIVKMKKSTELFIKLLNLHMMSFYYYDVNL